MFIVNCKSSSSVTLDLTSRDRYQLQLEISSEDPNINVSLPIGRLARQVMSPKALDFVNDFLTSEHESDQLMFI